MAEVSDEILEQIRELAEKGYGRNAIARAIGISGFDVTYAAKKLNINFEGRAMTQVATAAKVADAAARRADLALKQLEDAERLRALLWEPATAASFGGRDNTYNEVLIDEPSFEQKLKLQQAVQAAVNTAVRLLEVDSGSNAQTVNLVIKTAEHLGLRQTDGE